LFRAFLAAALAAAPIALLTATSAPVAAAGQLTITVSDASVTLGKKVTVSGEGPALRRLVLQVKTKENGWQQLASVTTGLAGTYAFGAPGWQGSHRLRVVAPPALLVAGEVSAAVTVTVRMPYRPAGRRSDWSWLGFNGARWDPCRTIAYRINSRGGYAGATSDARTVFRKLGRATGFRFKYLGSTTRTVTRYKHGYHPPGTDVIVDWQAPRQEGGLSGGVAGIGGHWVQDGRRFDGYMLLDPTERLARRTWRQVMTHELGHVLGLGHARSPSQMMHGTSSRRNVRLGAGDLAGLRRIDASRGCLATPEARTLQGAAPVPADLP
jgi:hypothetical protein